MTYNKNKTAVFIETQVYSSHIGEYLSDDEHSELQQYIMRDPAVGKIIRGTNGIRKVRWSRKGMGKSGGIRVIYYWAKARDQIYLLSIYSKSEKDSIDKKTLAQIAKKLEELK